MQRVKENKLLLMWMVHLQKGLRVDSIEGKGQDPTIYIKVDWSMGTQIPPEIKLTIRI